jgi:uncharacterized NAD-dependent epimerase/dehydratase family protein
VHPLDRQIAALELISDRRVVAITINDEGLDPSDLPDVCKKTGAETGLPVFDVLRNGADGLAAVVAAHLPTAGGAGEGLR